jgi:hypothetical protein
MRGHVDAESLALYAEGELSRGRTARVRAHLSGCPECGATLAALAEVTTQLSRVPVPAMPSAVAARLDAALSAEAAHRAAAPVPSAPVPSAPGPAGSSHRRPPRRNPIWSPGALRILAGAAVTLVVAGGVGYAVSQFSGSGTPSSASAPSAQHPAGRAAPNMSAGSTGGHAKKPHAGPYIPTSTTRYVRTGTNYRPSTLATQGKKVLAEYGVSAFSGPALLPAGSVAVQVRNCVGQTAHRRSVLVVDLARYQHHRAVVIILGQPDTVVVVTPSCAPLQSARLPVTSG